MILSYPPDGKIEAKSRQAKRLITAPSEIYDPTIRRITL
jgi:hypothetical protein